MKTLKWGGRIRVTSHHLTHQWGWAGRRLQESTRSSVYLAVNTGLQRESSWRELENSCSVESSCALGIHLQMTAKHTSAPEAVVGWQKQVNCIKQERAGAGWGFPGILASSVIALDCFLYRWIALASPSQSHTSSSVAPTQDHMGTVSLEVFPALLRRSSANLINRTMPVLELQRHSHMGSESDFWTRLHKTPALQAGDDTFLKLVRPQLCMWNVDQCYQ